MSLLQHILMNYFGETSKDIGACTMETKSLVNMEFMLEITMTGKQARRQFRDGEMV